MSKNGSDQAPTATVVLAPLGDDPAGATAGTSIPDPATPIGPAPVSGRVGSATLGRLGGGVLRRSGGCHLRDRTGR